MMETIQDKVEQQVMSEIKMLNSRVSGLERNERTNAVIFIMFGLVMLLEGLEGLTHLLS